MTERTSTIPQHDALSPLSLQSPSTNNPRDALVPTESVDEEPYTIKCICDYSDDDGNTIYCDTCDTWQHIECFYPGHTAEASQPDFSHFCADCKPRPLDKRKATERQRQQRQDNPSQNHDKKSKRPPSKSHKRKLKPSDLQVNGFQDHDTAHGQKNGSPHDQTSHTKKSKPHHRSGHSISTQGPKRSPNNHSRSHSHAHPLSPVTTPPDLPDDFVIHSYSKQLQDQCDNDPGPQELQANSFASLSVTDTMSLWLRDKAKLREDTGKEGHQDVFQICKPGFDFATFKWPELKVNVKEIPASNSKLQLRYLTTVDPISSNATLIGELRGFVGFQKDFFNEEKESFARLCHPAPFVFFTPELPLYIDTRREGSQCRYIRRSCRPNTTLDTYIANQSEYHFCFVNEHPLAAGEQITLAWDFKFPSHSKARYLRLLGLSDEDGVTEPEVTEDEYDELSGLIHNVLSDYGGCACGLGHDCAFVRFHRNYRGKANTQLNSIKPKKGRKIKQHISPTSTGHATNSRDVSEGRQETYDAEDDSRSTSGSIKARSRDMTPLTSGLDANGVEVVSERDKRKLVDIEKTFEKMDQAPPRKKKRGSDGPISSTSGSITNTYPPSKAKPKPHSRASISTSSGQPNGSKVRYKDASTSRHPSESPIIDLSPKNFMPPNARRASVQPPPATRSGPQSPKRNPNYVDASIQTEDEGDTWYNPTPRSRRRYVSLNEKLLKHAAVLWAQREARRASQISQQISQMELATRMEGVEGPGSSHASSPQSRISIQPDHAHLTTNGVDRAQPESTPLSVNGMPSGDTPMPDALVPVFFGPPRPPAANAHGPPKPPPPWPGVLSPVSTNLSISSDPRSNDLKIQMPTTPYPGSGPSFLSGGFPPFSPASSVAQSPLGGTYFPSTFSPSVLNSVGQPVPPVKKKLSLSAYNAMKKGKQDAASKVDTTSESDVAPSAPATTRAPSALSEEMKLLTTLEGTGSTLVESPKDTTKDTAEALGATATGIKTEEKQTSV
jgi:hypothetical protein